MNHWMLALICTSVGCHFVGANDKVVAPRQPPPSYGNLSVDGGRWLLNQVVVLPQTVTRYRGVTVVKGGKTVTEIVPYTITEMLPSMQTTVVSKARLVDATGREVEAKSLPGLLKKSPVVVISTGEAVDPYYRPLFKDGTLNLILPYPPGLEPKKDPTKP